MLAADIDLKELSGLEYSPIVIDHGSGMCKAGFAGEDLPRIALPTAVAHLNYEEEQEWEQHTQMGSARAGQSPGLYRQMSSAKKAMTLVDKRMPERVSSASSIASPSTHVTTARGNASIDTGDYVQDIVTIVGDDAFGVDRSNSSVSFSANSYTFNSVQSKNVNKKRDGKPFNSLSFPIKYGIIGLEEPSDWDDMEKIWESIFSHPKINCPPESQPVLFSECSENPKSNRERIAEIMFEKYKVPALYFASKPVLSLYASGKSTGLVLQMGHSVTQAVPIYEGFPLSHAIVRMNFGGADLTEYLKLQLLERLKRDSDGSSVDGAIQKRIDLHSIGGHKIVTDIKEKLCQVSLNYEKDKNSPLEKEYILPDRSVLRIGREVFSTAEAIFNPSLLGKNNILGVHEAVMGVYDKCDGYMRNLLAQNILLAGGSSNFLNMKTRLSHELKYAFNTKYGSSSPMSIPQFGEDNFPMVVKEPRERVLSSWTGGSILASLPMFQQLWVSKGDYDDLKSQALFSKCY